MQSQAARVLTGTPKLRGDRSSRSTLDALVTRRQSSIFSADTKARAASLAAAIAGRRVLVVGGAGSIGSMTTRLLADHRPAALHVVDQSENYLAELVRDLRGRPEGLPEAVEFRALPVDYGSPVMQRLLAEAPAYDVVLNFAALKHVRSEKDVYSLLQMLDTNIVKHVRFKEWLAQGGHGARYFAVSTDKAANPTSLMGASKRLMEDLVFGVAAGRSTTSARFANVAFSNGSLLQGFEHRLERLQPLAVPRDTKRYFVSHQEAGELCLLAACAVPDGHVAVPNLDPRTELQTLELIAVRVLEAHGFEPVFFEDEEAARRDAAGLAASDRWPILLTPLDTSGEKPYEEFVGEGETKVDIGFQTLSAVRHAPSRAVADGLFDRLAGLVNDPMQSMGKADIVTLVSEVLASFRHIESGKNLDQRL